MKAVVLPLKDLAEEHMFKGCQLIQEYRSNGIHLSIVKDSKPKTEKFCTA